MESYRLTLAVLSLTVFCSTVLGQSTLEKFRQDALAAHNMYRARHGCPSMKLSITLNNVAQKYAEHLASIGVMQHSSSGYGENLAWRSGGDWTGQQVTAAWYNEEPKYNYDAARFSSGTGHFTQVVWKSTTHVGFGKASRNGQVFVVANYSPAGNVQGQFRANVPRPVQQKTSELLKEGQPTSNEPMPSAEPEEPQPDVSAQEPRENNQGNELSPVQQETPEEPISHPHAHDRHVEQPPSQPEEPHRDVSRQRDTPRRNGWNGNILRWF